MTTETSAAFPAKKHKWAYIVFPLAFFQLSFISLCTLWMDEKFNIPPLSNFGIVLQYSIMQSFITSPLICWICLFFMKMSLELKVLLFILAPVFIFIQFVVIGIVSIFISGMPPQ